MSMRLVVEQTAANSQDGAQDIRDPVIDFTAKI